MPTLLVRCLSCVHQAQLMLTHRLVLEVDNIALASQPTCTLLLAQVDKERFLCASLSLSLSFPLRT